MNLTEKRPIKKTESKLDDWTC